MQRVTEFPPERDRNVQGLVSQSETLGERRQLADAIAAPDTPGVPRDRAARPSLDAVPELRRDRMSTVRQVIEGLTDESLDGHTEPVEAPGWPEPRSYLVRECLLIILNEEWQHRLYAERDPDALEACSA